MFIQTPNRYRKGPVGYLRARLMARIKEYFDHQLQHLDFARVPQWIEVAAQVRGRNLSRRMAPVQYISVWRPQGKKTMSGDRPLVLLDLVNSVLAPELRAAKWDEECLILQGCNFEV